MVKVDHIYAGNLTNTVGPAGTLRRILKNHNALEQRGYDVSVFSNGLIYRSWEDDFSSFHKNESQKRHKVKRWLDAKAKNSLCLSVILMVYSRLRTKKIVKSYLALNRNPNIVIFHSETEAYFYKKLGDKKATKSAMFLHSDGLPLKMFYIYYPKLQGSIYAKILTKHFEEALRWVNRCVFICKKGRENILGLYPETSNKASLVVNGIDDLLPDQLNQTRVIKSNKSLDKINLCTVGSVSVRKGQRLIIEALSGLDSSMIAKYHLTIIGDGPDKQYCEELVEKFTLKEHVTFTGPIPNNEVYKFLAKSDYFVLMSNNEGLPISILEAMRSGIGIIATNVSGIPELVFPENGILIPPSAEHLRQVLTDLPSKNHQLFGKESRRIFEERFTFKRMLDDYMEMLNTLIV